MEKYLVSLAMVFAVYEYRRIISSRQELHRFYRSVRLFSNRILRHYDAETCREQDYLKYFLDYYMWKSTRSIHSGPLKPEWIDDSLFSGWCAKVVRRNLVSMSTKSRNFFYSLQKGAKQNWPPLSLQREVAALQDHLVRISRENVRTPPELLSHVRDVGRKIFGPPYSSEQFTKLSPSPAACNENSRAKGGLHAYLMRKRGLYVPPNGESIGPEFMDHEFPYYRLERVRLLREHFDAYRTHLFDECFSEWERDKLKLTSEGIPVTQVVQPVAVFEPAKCRIITKMYGNLAMVLQPLQGMLIDRWKNTSWSTMRDKDLSFKVQTLAVACIELPLFASLDFQSATDYQNRDCTLHLLESIPSCPLIDAAIESFGPNVARYHPKLGIRDAVFNNGQLMGHPLSFPLLCAVNYSCLRSAVQRWIAEAESDIILSKIGREEGLKVLEFRKRLGPMVLSTCLVNGDDMLFKCDTRLHALYVEISQSCGFRESVGKSYLTEYFCQINSQVFYFSSHESWLLNWERGVDILAQPGFFRRGGYINQRFTSGSNVKKISEGGRASVSPLELSNGINEMLDYCPESNLLLGWIFDRWKNDFYGPGVVPNWYLPIHLGGMGVKPCFVPCTESNPTGEVYVTRQQRILAAHFFSNPRLALYRSQLSELGKKFNVDLRERQKIVSSLGFDDFTNSVMMFPVWERPFNPDPPGYSESVPLENDEWFLYLGQIAHFMMPRIDLQSCKILSASRIKRLAGLKPMSLTNIMLNWEVSFRTSSKPFAPVLGPVLKSKHHALDSKVRRLLDKHFPNLVGEQSLNHLISDFISGSVLDLAVNAFKTHSILPYKPLRRDPVDNFTIIG